MSEIITRIRNADLPEILQVLEDQQARQADVIVRAGDVRYEQGNLIVADTEASRHIPLISDDGVEEIRLAGSYRPTTVGDETMAGRLNAHGGWMKALRERGRWDILDATFNALLHGGGQNQATDATFQWLADHPDEDPGQCPITDETYIPEFGPFSGKLMLRLLRGDEGEEGVLRAVLSGKYKIMDNLTILLAVMDGIKQAGVEAFPSNFDLSDRKLYGRFEVPDLAMLAPKFLEGYRSPLDGPGGVPRAGEDRPGFRLRSESGFWSPERALQAAGAEGMGYPPGQEPIVWAGFVVSNSDVGGGSRTLAPQIRVKVCKNGLTLIGESDKRVHLGSDQDEGVVDWSADTQRKELSLITAQTTDLVRQWMSPEWFGAQVHEIERLAGVPVPEPAETMKLVAQSVKFTRTETEGILDHFLRGGLYTAGGVGNAVTSYSQTLPDADRAAKLDTLAILAMKVAAKSAA
jgi:hypothetical protein